jgi:uncharacterized protein (DUF1778 family)
MATGGSVKNERLDVRVTSEEKAAIREAAVATHQDVSTFLRNAIFQRIDEVRAEQRRWVLDSERWDAFNEALSGPAEPIEDSPTLTELLTTPSILEK